MQKTIKYFYDAHSIDTIITTHSSTENIVCVDKGIDSYFYLPKKAKAQDVKYWLTFYDKKVENSLKISYRQNHILVDNKYKHDYYGKLNIILNSFPNNTAYMTVDYEE